MTGSPPCPVSLPRLVLVHPDIPQNAGALMRLAACFGCPVHIVAPAGFVLDDRRLARALMDYRQALALTLHASWTAFLADRPPGRLVLLTTQGTARLDRVAFAPGDLLLLGSESAGAPPPVHEAADVRLRIPLQGGMRSLNITHAAAMALAVALHQLEGYPP